MKISKECLELALADKRTTLKSLVDSKELSGSTILKIRQGKEVLPRTVGKLTAALGVDVRELVKKG